MSEKQPLPCAADCPFNPAGVPMCHLGMIIAKEMGIFNCNNMAASIKEEFSEKSGITEVKLTPNRQSILVWTTSATPEQIRKNPKKAWIRAAEIKDGFITPLK